MMKNVLIAHQSTIPHYRVPFYNTLERLRPSSWRFDVVFDPLEIKKKHLFKESTDPRNFQFPILSVKTLSFKINGKTIRYQTFWRESGKYDLIVVGNSMNNLAYPLCQLHQLRGVNFAYWGHGKHRSIRNPSLFKRVTEKIKITLARRADLFFAYTKGVKDYVEKQGLSPDKVISLNNTIDIIEQRKAFNSYLPERKKMRKQLQIEGKNVLLFVGRFNKAKRIEFLLEAFSILQQNDPSFHLILVGSGGDEYINTSTKYITYMGAITDLDRLAPIYIASDVYVYPGLVGLGPLQAMCYDLPIITIDADSHKPEIEYLSLKNSIILPNSTNPEIYAQALINLFQDTDRLNKLKTGIWSSIKHLTIEEMARNFILGVNLALNK